jgi:hypothetical protein
MDFIPLAHTLLIVVQFTLSGRPANLAACLAGACPRFACNTEPISTSFTSCVDIPDRDIDSLIASAPRRVAGISFSIPPKLPMGVLTADTIYTADDFIVQFSAS